MSKPLTILLRYILLPILVLWALAFAIYNHDLISINLWPLPFVLTTPLSVLLLVALMIGYFLSACRACIKVMRLREQNATQKKQLENMEKQVVQPN